MTNPYHPFKPPFRYNEEGQWIEDAGGNRLLDLRGWGHLTGKCSLAMTEVEAARIQDGIGRRVTELMNADELEAIIPKTKHEQSHLS